MSDEASIDPSATSTGDSPINRVATAMRRISATVVGRPVSDEDLADAAEQLAAIADSLDANAASSSAPAASPTEPGTRRTSSQPAR